LDSLARVELVLRLEREFGSSLAEQALAAAETPRDLLRFLLASAGQSPRAADRTVASLSRREGVRPPAEAQTLVEALAWHVERQPERLTVFLYEDQAETPLTYGAIWEGASRYALRLSEAGLAPGQTVAIMLPTSKDYIFCFYGTLLAGGVPVPLYPPARLTTIEDHMTRHVGILKSCGAVLMVTVPEAKPLAWLLRAQVESLRAVLVPADFSQPSTGSGADFAPVRGSGGEIAFLQYTSGSTGQPKGVVLTHANLLANVRAMGRAAHAGAEDVFVSWLPLYHDMGLIGGCFATMYLGFPVVLMSPLAFLSRPSSWLRAIHRHGGTISGGPNFSYELCLRRIQDSELEGVDLSSWRFAFNGAEPVSPETLTAFEEKFSRFGFGRKVLSPVYGLAEASVGLAFTPPGEQWRVDLPRPRAPGARRRSGAGSRGRSRAAEDRRLRPGAAGPRPAHRRRRGPRAARSRRGAAAVQGTLREQRLLPQPGGDARHVRRPVGEHRRSRLPLGRHALHHRPREGRDHPRRPQHQSPTSSRRRWATSKACAAAASRCSARWTARAAPSGWWCSPRRAARTRRSGRR
jgi:acyl-CoA synthetase (AMP-forming)/AMP-acid ligase II